MLDAGVILEAVTGEILAVAALLETAVRHLGNDRDMGINPYTSKVQTLRQSHGAAMVLGPDRRGQAVFHIIGHGKGLCLILKFLDGDDGAKDFGLNQFIALF